MVGELGQFALIMAFCMALSQAILPFAGKQFFMGQRAIAATVRSALYGQCLFLVAAYGALSYGFLANDFSIAYVAANSNQLLPAIYRLSAVWGAHEGSLLLWALILSFWSVAFSMRVRWSPEPQFSILTVAALGIISSAFLSFILLASNPFSRLFPAPDSGADLNPFLQDPAFILHPPILYAGYVGYAVVFALTVSAMWTGRLDNTWQDHCRKWALAAWVCLSMGVALGSWWAYYELGWGGWWFWDPVENASLMPWLVGTGLLHALRASSQSGVFRHWIALLALVAFSLSLLGTFIVRSGVLISVHAFASDPTRGVFLLVLLAVVTGGSLLLFARQEKSKPEVSRSGQFTPVSREIFLLLVSVLFFIVAMTVIFGTLYPLIIEIMGIGKISVGPPYFNSVVLPIMMVMLLLMGTSAFVRPGYDRLISLVRRALPTLLLGVGLAIITDRFLAYTDLTLMARLMAVIALALAFWIILGTLQHFWQCSRERSCQERFWQLPLAVYAMSLAHIGFSVMVIGITIVSSCSTEMMTRLAVGERVVFAGHEFQLVALHDIHAANYRGVEAELAVRKPPDLIATLTPQKRIYSLRQMTTTEASIDPGLFRDLYVSLGERLDDDEWSILLYYRPFIRWIWAGIALMVIGGLCAIRARRPLALPVAKTTK